MKGTGPRHSSNSCAPASPAAGCSRPLSPAARPSSRSRSRSSFTTAPNRWAMSCSPCRRLLPPALPAVPRGALSEAAALPALGQEQEPAKGLGSALAPWTDGSEAGLALMTEACCSEMWASRAAGGAGPAADSAVLLVLLAAAVRGVELTGVSVPAAATAAPRKAKESPLSAAELGAPPRPGFGAVVGVAAPSSCPTPPNLLFSCARRERSAWAGRGGGKEAGQGWRLKQSIARGPAASAAAGAAPARR